MKKIIYLLTIGLFASGVGMAQVGNTNTRVKQIRSIDNSSAPAQKVKHESSYAKAGNVIWSDDFSNPATWEFQNSSTPNPLDWAIITDVDASPVAALSPINTTTASNGFAFINGDPEGDGSIQNADLTTANTIDLSGFDNVSLVFEQVSRNYATTYTVLFSTDNGLTWVSVPVNTDLEVNTNTANPEEYVLNATEYIAGESEVLIRFNFLAEWGWFWAIDDVSLVVTPDNDIRLLSAYYDEWLVNANAIPGDDPTYAEDVELVSNYEYSSYMIGQVRPLTLTGEVINQGSMPQTNVILEATIDGPGGTSDTYTSEAVASVAVGEVVFVTIPDVMPTGFADGGMIGDYEVSFSITSAEEDALPANNSVPSKTFSVNDEHMANDIGDTWTNYYTAYGQDVIWGHRFVMEQSQDFNFIRFAVLSTTDAESQPGELIFLNVRQGSVFAEAGGDNTLDLLFADDAIEYVVEANELTTSGDVTWITRFFPNDEGVTFEANEIYQGEVHVPPAGAAGIVWIPFSNRQSVLAGSLYEYADVSGGPNGWWSLGIVPLIRLGSTLPVGVEGPSDLNFKLGQNYPNPTTGQTRIDWELLVPAENVRFSVTDITGKTVYAQDLGDRPAGVQEPIELELNLAAGNYQYGLTIGNERIVRKMVVVK